ncbi:MAG: GNAT family N-acetyltransferase [Kiloniellales bacterium]
MVQAFVRPARSNDEAAWLAMWWDFVEHSGPPEPCSPDSPPAVWRWIMDPGHAMGCLIAESDGQVVGFVLYLVHPYSWTLRPICYLLDIYVRPKHRGAGLGRALIDALAEQGRAEGWLKIYWMTQADNTRAQALYDKVAERSSLVRYDLYLASH